MRYEKENFKKSKEYYNLEPNNLLEKTSNEKRNFFNGKNQKYIQKNIPKPKFRYYNNDEYNSIKKNKSCPKLNRIEQDTIKNKIDNDYYIYSDLYIDSYNDSFSSKNGNNQLNNIHLTKGRYMPDNSLNSQSRDYINKKPDYNYECNNNIFTRIVPKIDNNDSNLIIPTKLNYIYSKSKTPTKPYHNKKKKNNDNNIYNESFNSKQQTSLNNSKFINEPTNNIYDTKNDSLYSYKSGNSKRYIDLIGNKSDLDKCNKNRYIELFTLNDIKNIKKLNELQELKGLNIPKNQTHILIQTLSSMNNSFSSINNSNNNNNRNYENNNNIKYYPRKNNFLDEQKEEGKKSIRMTLSKIAKKNKSNKSYNCITFKEKNGLNRRKKNKNKRRNKTHDILQEENENRNGTHIKKEDDKGGKVVLYNNNLINYNRNIKVKNISQEENEIKSCKEYNYIYKNIIEVTRIQKWWKRIVYKIFIKKVIIIQKIFRRYCFRKNQNNNFEDKYLCKRTKNNILFITKDNKLPYDKIIFIQKSFRKYLMSKYVDKPLCNSYKRPKNICKIITKKRFSKKKKNNSSKIQFKNNNLKNAQSPKNKKHYYTKSKLSPITINKILLNESEIKYVTNNYIFLKKCYFRKPRFEEIDNEDKEIERPLTCEIMRKTNFKWNKRNLTPEIKRNNTNIDNSLKIIRLNDIQYKNIKKNRNEKKKFDNSLDNSKFNYNNKNPKNKDNLYENKFKKNSEKYNQSNLKKMNGDNNYKINLIKINETNLNKSNFSNNKVSDFNGQKRNNFNNNFDSFSKSHEIYINEKYNNKNSDILKSNITNHNILNNYLNLSFNINKNNDIIHNNNNKNLNNNEIKINYNYRNNFNNLKISQKSNDSINNKYNENNINFIKNKNDNFNNQNIHNNSSIKINENNNFNIHTNIVYSINNTKVRTYKIDNNKSNNNINYNNEYEYENKNNINDNKKTISKIKKINYFNMLNDSKNSSFQDNYIKNDYNNNFIYTSNSKNDYKSDTGRIELRENKWDSNSLKSSESNL